MGLASRHRDLSVTYIEGGAKTAKGGVETANGRG